MSSVTRLLQRLVSTPSVNPALPGAPDILGEHRMTALLDGLLAGCGFETRRVETAPGRPSLVATFGPDKPGRTLMIEGHLDTVAVAGMTIDPFSGEERDGRVWGRGACDMKGPMAAALDAMDDEVLAAFRASDRRLMFVGAIDEEIGAKGARMLADLGIGADEAIVLEPTGGDIVTAHKGPAWMFVTLRGRAGHGSDPARGVNAIDAAAELIPRLHELHRSLQPAAPHPLLGLPTLNIGRIQAGTAANVIPDECRIDIDRRVLPGDSAASMVALVRAELERMQAAGRITGFELSTYEAPSFQTPADGPLVRRLAAASRAHGVEPRVLGTSWFSDAGAFSRTCREIVVFGPGHIAQAHTRDEFIDVPDLLRARAILKDLMLDFALKEQETD